MSIRLLCSLLIRKDVSYLVIYESKTNGINNLVWFELKNIHFFGFSIWFGFYFEKTKILNQPEYSYPIYMRI